MKREIDKIKIVLEEDEKLEAGTIVRSVTGGGMYAVRGTRPDAAKAIDAPDAAEAGSDDTESAAEPTAQAAEPPAEEAPADGEAAEVAAAEVPDTDSETTPEADKA